MRVDRIEVKRCFVASNKAKELRGKDEAAFLAGLAELKEKFEVWQNSILINRSAQTGLLD